ncbi:MAG: hypothetical protein RL637_1771 [Pseudomonadota bacterium]|jgi:capsular polysaccharide transport system ATP-binding protein
MIIFNQVGKYYIQRHPEYQFKSVLEQVSLTIAAKQSVGIIGQSHSGRSTLLKLIAGIEYPSSGKIQRGGRISWPIGAAISFNQALSGRQNARFIIRLQGGDNQLTDYLTQIHQFSELASDFDRPLKSYTPNMRAKLQLALSMAFEMDFYIADELNFPVETKFKQKLHCEIKQRLETAGFILISQNETQLKTFCQAGIWLHRKQAYWFDEIEEAFKYYTESQTVYD